MRISLSEALVMLATSAWIASGLLVGCASDGDPSRRPIAPLETEKPASAQQWKRYADWPQGNWKDFNTLVTNASPPVSKPPAVAYPIQGDSDKGKKLAFDRSRGGSCVACHVMGPSTPSLPGNVGPDLSAIGSQRPDDWLFGYVWDARNVNPQTVMPPWGTNRLFTADEIKDIVAFLKTLQTPYVLKDANEDPNRRELAPDDRDAMDPTENPALFALDEGKALFAQPGPTGKSCASCHAEPAKSFRSWAATMPYFEPRVNKVLGVEEFVTRHARATTGADYLLESKQNLALSIYLRNLANGETIAIDTSSPGAKAAVARGNDLLERPIGQLNFSCTDCHQKAADHWIRGQWLGDLNGQLGRHPYFRTSQGDVWDLRKRFQWCGVAVRANELSPDAPAYGDLELALTVLNQGRKLATPGIGH